MWKLHVGGSAVLHIMDSINIRTSVWWNTAEFARVLHFTMLFVCSAHHTPSYWMQLLLVKSPDSLFGMSFWSHMVLVSSLDIEHCLNWTRFCYTSWFLYLSFPSSSMLTHEFVLMMHTTSLSSQSWTKISHLCLFGMFSAFLS